MTEATTVRPSLGAPPSDDILLEVRDLRTSFKVMDGVVPAVDGISFSLAQGGRPWASSASRGRARA